MAEPKCPFCQHACPEGTAICPECGYSFAPAKPPKSLKDLDDAQIAALADFSEKRPAVKTVDKRLIKAVGFAITLVLSTLMGLILDRQMGIGPKNLSKSGIRDALKPKPTAADDVAAGFAEKDSPTR